MDNYIERKRILNEELIRKNAISNTGNYYVVEDVPEEKKHLNLLGKLTLLAITSIAIGGFYGCKYVLSGNENSTAENEKISLSNKKHFNESSDIKRNSSFNKKVLSISKDTHIKNGTKSIPYNKFLDSNTDQHSKFLKTIKPAAIKAGKKYGVLPSVIMAQAAIESNYGNSNLSRKYYNYFGIKADLNQPSVSMPTAEYNESGQKYYIISKFVRYSSIEDSLDHNASLLRHGIDGASDYYKGTWVENNNRDFHNSTYALRKYATAPNYSTALDHVIEIYDLNLYDAK